MDLLRPGKLFPAHSRASKLRDQCLNLLPRPPSSYTSFLHPRNTASPTLFTDTRGLTERLQKNSSLKEPKNNETNT